MSRSPCGRMQERITLLLDGELPAAQAADVQRHLAACADCARAAQAQEAMRVACRALPPAASTASDRLRIVQAALAEQRAAKAGPGTSRTMRLASFLGRRLPEFVTASALAASVAFAWWLRTAEHRPPAPASRLDSGTVLTWQEYRCELEGRRVETHGRFSLSAPD
jgi:anti-sigma factor RsiW